MTQPDAGIAARLAQVNWHEERRALHAILLGCGLAVTVKWGQLCYMIDGRNLALFFGLKEYCGIGFFKGALLEDPSGLLHRQGENSQAIRLMRFTSTEQIDARRAQLIGFVEQAISAERAGRTVDFALKHNLALPAELVARLAADAALKQAFEALTPGRQRGYTLHFSAPKKPETRLARIDKCAARILAGKGMNDR